MRSVEPMPGNPWPHDMVLKIDGSPHALLELLWAREAWGLDPSGAELPPPLTEAPVAAALPPEVAADWTARWPFLWDAVVEHAGTARNAPADHVALLDTANGSEERAALLAAITGPRLRDHLGDSALDERYDTWVGGRFAHQHPQVPLEETPERVCLDALIPAWESGLLAVVLIPCRGDFTRTIGASTLLMTEETRDDASRYRDALGQFA